MNDVTQLIQRLDAGDAPAAGELLPLVYAELRRLAAEQLGRERAGHTLSPTALVHEAYLRLLGPAGDSLGWNSRGHFFAAAAQAMRRILVDHARRKRALKRGGDGHQVSLEDLPAPRRERDLLALHEVLGDLEREHPHLAEFVTLRYFAGLTMAQAADALGISLRTAERHWTYARAWLLRALAEDR